MKRYLICLIAIFIVNTAFTQEKKKITISEINYIEIHKNESGQRNPTHKLTSEQLKDFVNKWNDSKGTGICKYWSNFNITVYSKNNLIPRKFRTNNNSIKENNDYCFDVGTEKYFEKIWEQLNN